MQSRFIIAFVIQKRIKGTSMKNDNKKNLIEIHDFLQFFI